MVVLEAGFKRMLGKMNLDPNGALAMKGQKHPITAVGIRNLTAKLIKMWEAETKFAECEVTIERQHKDQRPPRRWCRSSTRSPRQDFKFHVARLFFDNELQDSRSTSTRTSGRRKQAAKPPLEESYTYQNLKLNNNFTAPRFRRE